MEAWDNPDGVSVQRRFQYAMTEGTVAAAVSHASGVLVGFSGGADSAALLILCAEYCAVRDIPLLAVHVHHGIRGADADADADACCAFCAARAIPLCVEYRNVPDYASRHGLGMEEAARQMRYEAFAHLLDAHPGYVLAIAHSADDNLETVLFHLIRGTGLSGLCGIPPVRGRIIRPLLDISAADIRTFCRKEQIPFVQDGSNSDTAYTRNYIRAEVVPSLRQISPSPEAAVARMCRLLRQDAEYLEGQVEHVLVSCVKNDRASVSALTGIHDAVLSRVCIRMYENAAGSRRDLREEHVRQILRLLRRGGDWKLSLPGNMTAFVSGGYLAFEQTGICCMPTTDFLYPLTEGEHVFPEFGFGVCFSRGEFNNQATLKNIYKLSTCTSLSFATIQGQVFLRFRKDGDTIRFGGMTRRVKKLLNAAAMPAEQRARIPFFCDEAGIVWIPGFPVRDGSLTEEKDAYFAYYTIS